MDKKQLKDIWKEKAIDAAGDAGYLMVKQLASIIDTGETKVRNDIKANRLGRLKMGPETTKCRMRIPIEEAVAYIDSFVDEPCQKPPIEESPLFRGSSAGRSA